MGFNQPRPQNTRETHEGGRAYKIGAEQELYLTIVTSLMSGDSFYESDKDRIERVQALIRANVLQGDAEFVACLAAYAREEMYLRTAPTMLVAELFARGENELATKAAYHVWVRGDEHLEALAYFKTMGYKRTKALLRAVAKRLNEMSEKAMVKYAAGRKSYSQKDAIRVAHPVPKDEKQSALFKYVVHGWDSLTTEEAALLPHIAKLKAGGTQTWEQHISKEGSSTRSWTEAVEKMGYMALLRNLRNLVEAEVDSVVLDRVCNKLTDQKEVRYSKQLPFRFQSAYNALPRNTPQALFNAVSMAADLAAENVPDLEGETLVLVDCSASMRGFGVSKKSVVTNADAARCLGGILVKKGNAELWGFGQDPVRVTAPAGNPVMSTVSGMKGISRHTGHATFIEKAIEASINDRFRRVVVLTDMQSHDNPHRAAQRWLDADRRRKLYIIDMEHYGLPSFDPNHPGVVMVGGFSDKVFDWMRAMEVDDPVATIRSYIKA